MKAKQSEGERETIEINLNQKQCAEVALYMFQEYQQAMEPPIFAVISFEDWLHRLINQEDNA